jgi:hypothetical protein
MKIITMTLTGTTDCIGDREVGKGIVKEPHSDNIQYKED